MKMRAVACFSLLLAELASGQGYVPREGYVPNSVTALRIAEAVLTPIYGEKQINSEKPFIAKLKDGVWTVQGTLHCPDGTGGITTHCDGGTAEVRISKTDGRILFMMHYK